MAAPVRVVAVVTELIAFDLGHWCRRCALPSGFRAWVTVRTSSRMHLQERRWCDQCGHSDVAVDEPAAS